MLVAAMQHITGAADGSQRETLEDNVQNVARLLAALIDTNPPAATPWFDGHAIDIALGLLALNEARLRAFAAGWIENTCARILLAYKLGKHFPIYTDSYDDLVAMHVDQGPPKEKLMQLSTLLPMLAHWHAVLDMGAQYEAFQNSVVETFGETTLQLWFPLEDTEEHLYRENAGFTSGTVMAPIGLPATLDELRAHVVRLHRERQEFEGLSCFAQGWPILSLIASRHHRTPVIPAYWQRAVGAPPAEEQPAG